LNLNILKKLTITIIAFGIGFYVMVRFSYQLAESKSSRSRETNCILMEASKVLSLYYKNEQRYPVENEWVPYVKGNSKPTICGIEVFIKEGQIVDSHGDNICYDYKASDHVLLYSDMITTVDGKMLSGFELKNGEILSIDLKLKCNK